MPGSIRELPIYQRLYLLTHSTSGVPLMEMSALSHVLAGGVLIHLAVAGRLHVPRVFVELIETGWPLDPVADGVVERLATFAVTARTPHYMIRRLAPDLRHRVAGILLATGVVTVSATSRADLRPVADVVYANVDGYLRRSIIAEIEQAADSGRMDLGTWALARLIDITPLSSSHQPVPAPIPIDAGAFLDHVDYLDSVNKLLAATADVMSELPTFDDPANAQRLTERWVG